MHTLLRLFAIAISAVAVALNLYIYGYHFLDSKCNWPNPNAEIKLLAFGDPQIRGIAPQTPLRNKVDITGNDFFLGHIYRVMMARFKPTHVAVMGDLLSSQWIPDEEFYKRVERYKSRIFRHSPGNRQYGESDCNSPMFVNVSGNHDVGYAGEMTPERINRYEDAFGKVNFVEEFSSGWRLVVLNSLALDGPGVVPDFHEHTERFLSQLRERNFQGPTVLLTHVPLAKPQGICSDGPQFVYYEQGTLHEQNHISIGKSELVLNSVFGAGNPHGGIVLTGHDHEGCESVYEYDHKELKWTSAVYTPGKEYQNYVKEVTVRSMMGEFGGNTGIMSGTLQSNGTWTFEYSLCRFAVQHIWWVTQVVTLIAVLTDSAVFLRAMF